jgi:4-hydroxybenzoate polyprenyltransferase
MTNHYVEIARIDHWFKNAFMLLGVVIAFFYKPSAFAWHSLPVLIAAFFITCLIASSNYVLNEIVDAPTDRFHPTKRQRPIPSGKVRPALAVLEWILLGSVGIVAAFHINAYFGSSAFAFWLMGLAYNVPPVRLKEYPYVDVLSESINNPIRLLLGWFSLIPDRFPPLSLALCYWMVGALFMATKRLAEYRKIGNPVTATKYRKSFGHYTEDRLLISMFFYVAIASFFGGVFVVRYHLELILFIPAAAGFIAYYVKLGLQEDSPAQNPEQLFRQKKFILYTTITVVLFLFFMFIHIPTLYDLFNVQPLKIEPLWTIK